MNFGLKQAGLSMLELLVVFVIVGLVSTLLMQGLGFGLSLFERVHGRSESYKQEVLVRQWFRQVNESLVTKTKPLPPSLIGESDEFIATTLNPLLGDPGVASSVSWKIEQGYLWYEEAGSSLRIVALPNQAEFRYRNRTGQWISGWPEGDDTERLPTGVLLETAEGTLLAVLKVRDRPDVLLEESRRERG